MYVRCDESSLYSRINYGPAPTGTSRECPGIIKRCTQGLARTRIVLCQRLGADTEETGRRTMWKDLCSECSLVNSNELSKV